MKTITKEIYLQALGLFTIMKYHADKLTEVEEIFQNFLKLDDGEYDWFSDALFCDNISFELALERTGISIEGEKNSDPIRYKTCGGQVVFKENNLGYGQDMSFHAGIPSDVPFTVEYRDSSKSDIVLSGEGYGNKNNYGNGKIYPFGLPEDILLRLLKLAGKSSK